MGYAYVPELKESWVCETPCNHTDCKLTREQWTDAKCAICGEPMLAGQPFYYNDDKKPEHAHCTWDKAGS